MENPICDLYFFCDPYTDDPGSYLDMGRVLKRVQKAICENVTVPGFSYVRETSTGVPRKKAEEIIEGIGSKWVFYPNAAVIRHDGVVLGVHLANGSSVYNGC